MKLYMAFCRDSELGELTFGPWPFDAIQSYIRYEVFDDE